MWHCIFSISFTGSKSNSWKTIIHLITASNNSQNTLVIYVIDLSTKNKMQRREFIFYKNQKYRRLERGKKMYFLVISFQEFLNFSIWAFSKNVQFFLGVFLKANIFVLIKTFWRRRRTTSSRRLHQDECLLGIIIIIIVNIVFVVAVVMLQNRQVMVTSFGCCWYSGGIPTRSAIDSEHSTWY